MKSFTRAVLPRMLGICVLTVAAGAASAQTAQTMPAPGAVPAPQSNWTPVTNGLPPVQEVNGIRYVSGGFGEAETAVMRQAMSNYRVSMVFSQASGAFVADVPVRIQGVGNAPSLEIVSRGPFLLIDLPPGRYSIQATYAGRELTRDVTVSADSAQQVSFAW